MFSQVDLQMLEDERSTSLTSMNHCSSHLLSMKASFSSIERKNIKWSGPPMGLMVMLVIPAASIRVWISSEGSDEMEVA